MKEYLEKKEKLTFVEEWVKKLMEQVFLVVFSSYCIVSY